MGMKNFRVLLWMAVSFLAAFFGALSASAHSFDAKLVAKLEAYVGQCNGPGAEPKPKMAEFVSYLQTNGFRGAKVECGVSNLGAQSPMILIFVADASEYYVNFKKKGKSWQVSDVLEDANTPAGVKRAAVWPAPGKVSSPSSLPYRGP